MTFFATLAIPALAAALAAYFYARTHHTLLAAAVITVIIYGSIANIIVQRGTLLRWEMLLDHLIGMVLLGVVAAVAFVSGQKERKR